MRPAGVNPAGRIVIETPCVCDSVEAQWKNFAALPSVL
ncbi:hypothetical protein QF040_003441 [Variovorax sp. W2I14]